MAVPSVLTMTPDESCPADIKSNTEISAEVDDGSPKKREEENMPSTISPPTVSRSTEEENGGARDNDCENERTWKGDPWSQEDVRNF